MTSTLDPLETLRGAANGLDVADALRLAILDGTLQPGTRLVQPQIAQAFGISRTPVREALHKLHGWGLVDLIVNHAAVVRRVRREQYANAFVVWAELAALAVGLATKQGSRVTEQLRAAVREEWTIVDAVTAQGAEQSAVAGRWTAVQTAFHAAVLAGSGSTRVRATIATTTELLRWETMWKAVEDRPYPLRSFALRHEEIMVLMQRNEPPQAAACMREHIIEMGDTFLAWLDRTSDASEDSSNGE